MSINALGLESLGLFSGDSQSEIAQALVFAFAPNWKSPVTEVFEWRTDVLEAHNRVEQRRSTRDEPTHVLQYSILLTDATARLYDDFVATRVNDSVLVPLWPDSAALLGGLPRFTLDVACDTADRRFKPQGRALIFASATEYEVVEIDAVIPGHVLLAAPTRLGFSAGAKIVPVFEGWIDMAAKARRLTAGVLTAEASLTVVESDSALIPAVVPPHLNGVEVMSIPHNWREAVDVTSTGNTEVLSFGRGLDARFARGWAPAIDRSLQASFFGRAAVTRFRAFLTRRQGRLRPCYVPSAMADYTLVQDIAIGDAAIYMQGGGAFKRERPDAIKVKLPTGSVYYRIVGVSTTETRTRLTLAEPADIAVIASDVQRVSALRLSRMAADRVSVSWKSHDVAEAELGFVSLVERPARRSSTIPIRVLGASSYGGEHNYVVPLPAAPVGGYLPGDLLLAFSYRCRLFATTIPSPLSWLFFKPRPAAVLYDELFGDVGYMRLGASNPINIPAYNPDTESATALVAFRYADGVGGLDWHGGGLVQDVYDMRISYDPPTCAGLTTTRQRSLLLLVFFGINAVDIFAGDLSVPVIHQQAWEPNRDIQPCTVAAVEIPEIGYTGDLSWAGAGSKTMVVKLLINPL